MRHRLFFGLGFIAILALTRTPATAQVDSVSPPQNALAVARTATIEVTFSSTMKTTSFNDTASFIVTGLTSGRHAGSFGFSAGNTVATFTPDSAFSAGEIVVVDVSSAIEDTASTPLLPFVYTFTVEVDTSPGVFAAKTDYPTGSVPMSVFVSDVDGDGDGDLAVANYISNTVSIFKNNGDGTFAAMTDYATGMTPLSVFVSDVDGDGDGDLAVANAASNTVSILKNNGDGTFAAGTEYVTGVNPFSVFVSDVDGDGDGDLAVANENSGTVSILLNNGDGTFAAKTDYATGSNPYSVFVSDVDGDGDGDLTVANSGSNTVSILLNNGDGTFAAKTDYATGSSPRLVFVSDVDGDGDGDLALANHNSSTVSILLNNGDGTFAAKTDYAAGSGPISVFISDIDGDGDGDLAVTNSGASTVSIFKNNGDGTFATKTDYATGPGPNSVFVSDVDGDGDGDLAVVNETSSTISILKNRTTVVAVSPAEHAPDVSRSTSVVVTFSDPIKTSTFNDTASFIVTGLTSGRHSGSFGFSGANTVATFTPDTAFSAGEIVVVDVSSAIEDAGSAEVVPFVYTFTVEVENSPGLFAARIDYATGSNPQSVFLSDIDGDGDGDLAVVNFISNTVSILKNNGDGTFAPRTDYATGTFPTSVFVSDVDGDGNGDLAVANGGGSTVSILKNNGDGTFAAKTDYPTESNVVSLFVSDVDGDGDGDLALANSSANTVSILKNNGDGTFAAKTDYATGAFPYSVFVSDVDGDGDGDLAVANYNSSTVSILRNNGDGTFAPKTDYATGSDPYSVFISDVDGDGDGDLAVASSGDNTVSILENNGDGTFATRTDYMTGSSPYSVFVTDVDGDGDGDLAVANNTSNTVSILKNNGDGTFAAKTDYATGTNPISVFVSDLNGDGVGDLAVANLGSDSVSILKGISTRTITVTQTLNGTISPGTTEVIYGSAQSFTITPSPGYDIDSVVVDDVKVDSTTSYTFTNVTANHTITAYYSITLNVSIQDKWNIISVPLTMDDYTMSVLFPTATTGAFAFDLSYTEYTLLENGRGYWAKFSGNQSVPMTGQGRTEDTVAVQAGWNIVGSLSSSIAASGVGSIPGGIVTSNFYGYDGSYTSSTVIEPGKGYWVKASQAGQLVMTTTAAVPVANRIRIEDTGELPPPPPDEIGSAVPEIYALEQNYPNPFNPATSIRYATPEAGRVTLTIYNMLGQRVAVLVDEVQEAGFRTVSFDASALPSGVYTYRITAGSFSDVKRMVFLK